jgi:hypothetical protein
LVIRTVYRPLRPAIADLAGWQSGSGDLALALAEGGNLMGSVKWAAVLVAVVISALDALANLLLALLTPHAVPVVVNLFALAVAGVAAIFAFVAHLAVRTDAKIETVVGLLTRRLEDLEARVGDRNSGFVEGYMLGHSIDSPEASVVPLTPRPRRLHHAED